eukprot:10699280-Alexandrium_andersonii.AAC.1
MLLGDAANLMRNVAEELLAEGGAAPYQDLAGMGPEAPRIEVATAASSGPSRSSAVLAAAAPVP